MEYIINHYFWALESGVVFVYKHNTFSYLLYHYCFLITMLTWVEYRKFMSYYAAEYFAFDRYLHDFFSMKDLYKKLLHMNPSFSFFNKDYIVEQIHYLVYFVGMVILGFLEFLEIFSLVNNSVLILFITFFLPMCCMYAIFYFYTPNSFVLPYDCFECYYSEYSVMFLYIIVCFALSTMLMLLSYLCTMKDASIEKLSSYECGFESFDDSRKTFDAHFYMVGVLFLVFDLEMAFLFPWAVYMSSLSFFSFFIALLFMAIITMGFAYEWSSGVLDWSSNYK